MHLTVVFYRDATEQWRWRAVAANNQIVANCGEGYENKTDCTDIAGQLFLQENEVTFAYEDNEE